MISPQESGKPNDAASYSWSPFGPYNYWRKRIGEEIAKAILTNCDEQRPCAVCEYNAELARGTKNND